MRATGEPRAGDPAGARTAYGNYLAGRFAGSLRDAAGAARYFDRALAYDPDNDVIRDRAFLLQLASGDIAAAQSRAEIIAARDPEMRLSQVVLGLGAAKKNDFASARAHFMQMGTGPFNLLVSRLVIAWTFAGEGDSAAALDALAEIQASPSFDLFRLYHKALILELTNRLPEAEAAYKELLAGGGNTSLRVIEAYGRFLERQKRLSEARKVYDDFGADSAIGPVIEAALARIDANVVPPPMVATASDGVAEVLFGMASALAQDRSLDLPLVYLRLALYLRPDFDVAQILLADLLQAARQPADANRILAQVSKASPLAEHAAMERAVNLDQMGKTDDALSTMRGLAERKGGNLRAFVALGDLQRAHEKFADAAESYTRALALVQPDDKRYWSLHYVRGVALERAGRWPDAERDLQKALELSPEQPVVLNYLGYSWIEKGERLDQALKMIERAVELMPDDGYIVDSLGWAHYQLGNYDRAAIYLEQAVNLRPEDPIINDHLGDAYWRVGRLIEARFQWRHALALAPDKKLQPKLEQKLDYGLDDTARPMMPSAKLGSSTKVQ